MRPNFQPRLVNGPFGDPALFIPFRFQRRALLFDAGQLCPLSPRELLKVTHLFITHTHMDHFMGFDKLLRVFLGRPAILHIFGPPGFFGHVQGKLAGYTWNLVEEFQEELLLEISEVHPEKIVTRTFECKKGFRPRDSATSRPNSGLLWEEPSFSVRGVLVDHRIPCLALCLEEHIHINIIKEKLHDLGLPVGPWLNRFKQAIYEKRDPESLFKVTWTRDGEVIKEKTFPLGELIQHIARISPGKKIGYVADMIGSKENRQKVLPLIQGADLLFTEAAFLDQDRSIAHRKYHLTAREAGLLAREAGVKKIKLFHFSPRYEGRADELEREAMEAFLHGANQP